MLLAVRSPPTLQIVVASGTGTTALFLAQFFACRSHTNLNIEVLAVPCVGGGASYLREQMEALNDRCGGGRKAFPSIVDSASAPKRKFAQPCKEHYEIYAKLLEHTGIEFDLIYAPRAFEVLAHSIRSPCQSATDPQLSLRNFATGSNVIYYHCGGVEGNTSQLRRYKNLNMTTEINKK